MENDLVEWIVKIGRQCKESKVSDVFISSLRGRTQKRLSDTVITMNNILKRVCKLNGLGFTDSNNICLRKICLRMVYTETVMVK